MSKKKLVELYVEEEELLFTAAAQIQLGYSCRRTEGDGERGLSGLDVGYNVDSSTFSMSISELIREDERGFRNYSLRRYVQNYIKNWWTGLGQDW